MERDSSCWASRRICSTGNIAVTFARRVPVRSVLRRTRRERSRPDIATCAPGFGLAGRECPLVFVEVRGGRNDERRTASPSNERWRAPPSPRWNVFSPPRRTGIRPTSDANRHQTRTQSRACRNDETDRRRWTRERSVPRGRRSDCTARRAGAAACRSSGPNPTQTPANVTTAKGTASRRTVTVHLPIRRRRRPRRRRARRGKEVHSVDGFQGREKRSSCCARFEPTTRKKIKPQTIGDSTWHTGEARVSGARKQKTCSRATRPGDGGCSGWIRRAWRPPRPRRAPRGGEEIGGNPMAGRRSTAYIYGETRAHRRTRSVVRVASCSVRAACV